MAIRVSQDVIEAVGTAAAAPTTRMSQVVMESLGAGVSRTTRMSQIVVEAIFPNISTMSSIKKLGALGGEIVGGYWIKRSVVNIP